MGPEGLTPMQAEPTPSLRIPDCLPASRAVASLLPAAGRQVFNPLGHIDFWPRRKPPLPACRKISVQTTNCRESDGSEVYGAPCRARKSSGATDTRKIVREKSPLNLIQNESRIFWTWSNVGCLARVVKAGRRNVFYFGAEPRRRPNPRKTK